MELRAPPSADRMRLSEERPRAVDDHRPGGTPPPLGVSAIVGDTFAIFFRRIHWFTLLTLVPLAIAGALLLTLGIGAAGLAGLFSGTMNPDRAAGGASVAVLVVTIFAAIALAVMVPMALSVLAAYDAKLGRPFRLGHYVVSGLRPIVPLLLCWILVSLLAGLASTLFILPGLWVLSVYAVVAPAIVVERLGFGGLGRSVALTKGYRWPILGAMLVIYLGAILLGGVVSAILAAVDPLVPRLDPGLGADLADAILGTLLQSLYLAVTYSLPCVGVALIYARLREVKEGASVESLAEVFA